MVRGQTVAQSHRQFQRLIIVHCFEGSTHAHQYTITDQRYLLLSDKLLGNHFHKEKQETFLITEGSGKFAYPPRTTEGEPWYKGTVDIEKELVIQIQPFTAHAFMLEPGSAMICFSTEHFDSDNQICLSTR